MRQAGKLGLAASVLIWVTSLPVLGLAMRAQATTTQGVYRVRLPAAAISHLHAVATGWALLFALLQVVAPMILAWTLRSAYGLRVAVCVSISVGCSTLVNALSMFGLLLALRLQLGTG